MSKKKHFQPNPFVQRSRHQYKGDYAFFQNQVGVGGRKPKEHEMADLHIRLPKDLCDKLHAIADPGDELQGISAHITRAVTQYLED